MCVTLVPLPVPANVQRWMPLIIPARGSVTVNADAMKTSAGALHTLPVCREQNLKNTLQFLKDSGFRIVAATEKGDYDLLERRLYRSYVYYHGCRRYRCLL